MEPLVADLLTRYEKGGLTRRQLIQGLALLAVPATAAAAEGGGALKGVNIHHIQVSVKPGNLVKTAEFYTNLFGARVTKIRGEGNNTYHLTMDKGPAQISLKDNPAAAKVPVGLHHFCVGLDPFDAKEVAAAAKKIDPTVKFNDAGGFITDPNGVPVQIYAKSYVE